MASTRALKVADRIKEIVAEALESRVKDPRLGFITLTDVRVTGDLQQASIFYTVLGDEEAKKTSVFLLFPPMPKLVRFITPATPLWAGVATLAGASLPDWARDLYGWPSIPGQNIATDISLRTFRNATLRLPQSLRESPLTKKARDKVAK